MNTRMPRLLDASLRERARLSPIRLSLDLRLRPLSTAEMRLPATEPEVQVRDLIELYDEHGSVGMFRVTGVDLLPGLSRTVYLEHSLTTLADGIVPATSMTGTVRETIQHLLSYQPVTRWTLGEVDMPEDTVVLFTCGCTNLLAALTDLLELLPDELMLDFEQTCDEWILHLRRMSNVAACEGRLSRNLASVQVSCDASGLCTRVYPYGAGQGTERISLTPLLGVDWLESETAGTWGRVCRTFTAASIFDVPTLKAVAEKYLTRHGQPTVSITASAVDLSEMTGEAADSFRLGQMCRLVMPDWGMVMHERVVAIRKPDVIAAPGQMTLILSSQLNDTSDEIADMLREVTNSKVIGGRVTDAVVHNRAEGTASSPIVHYFYTQDWAAILACTMSFDPDDGVRVVDVAVDGNPVPNIVFSDGIFDALPYLRRDALGLVTTGRHTFTVYPNSGPVNTTIAMKVIEKI